MIQLNQAAFENAFTASGQAGQTYANAKLGGVIGRGGHGDVHLLLDHSNLVAKRIPFTADEPIPGLPIMRKGNGGQLLNEIAASHLVSPHTAPHPNVVAYHGHYIEPAEKHHVLIYDKYDMSLGKWLDNCKASGKKLSPEERYNLAGQFVKGCLHVMQQGIFHCDILPNNALVHLQANKMPIVKVADFGLVDYRPIQLYRTCRDIAITIVFVLEYDIIENSGAFEDHCANAGDVAVKARLGKVISSNMPSKWQKLLRDLLDVTRDTKAQTVIKALESV